MPGTFIANDFRMIGDIETSGDVEISGYVEGSLRCGTLVISETGHVNGLAAAQRIIVRGKVEGAIGGVDVKLASSAHVEASIVYSKLTIDTDAFFSGKSRRVENNSWEMGQFTATRVNNAEDTKAA